MKKLISFLCSAVLLAGMLVGCGSDNNVKEPQLSVSGADAEKAWETYDVNFDAEQTRTMSNFMSCGYHYIDGDTVYGLTHDEDSEGDFGSMKFHMEGGFPELEAMNLIDEEGVPSYMFKDGDYLYYIRSNENICRFDIKSGDIKVLYEGTCSYLQKHDGKLYFTDENNAFVSADMDGKNITTVIDKEVYYPYFICSDWVIFQDDADGESLHIYNTTYGVDAKVTNEPSYTPVIDGNFLYYTKYAADGENYNLCRVDMSQHDSFTAEVNENPLVSSEFMIDESKIYVTDASYSKDQWKDVKYPGAGYNALEVYVSPDYNIYYERDDEGIIIGKYLFSKAQSGASKFY